MQVHRVQIFLNKKESAFKASANVTILIDSRSFFIRNFNVIERKIDGELFVKKPSETWKDEQGNVKSKDLITFDELTTLMINKSILSKFNFEKNRIHTEKERYSEENKISDGSSQNKKTNNDDTPWDEINL